MDQPGLEPGTSRLLVSCSNQLSYKTDNEAYIDGFLTAEEEFYTGAEPGSSLPLEGDDDYEEDYDDGYGY